MHPSNRNFVVVGTRNFKCTAEANQSFQQSINLLVQSCTAQDVPRRTPLWLPD